MLRARSRPYTGGAQSGSGLSHGEEGGFVLAGEMSDVAGTVAGDVDGVAGGQEFAVGLAKEFVAEFQGAVFCFEDAGADDQEFVVAGGMMIAAVDVGDDDEGVVLSFHQFVIKAEGAHQLDAADLEPNQVVRVIHHAHLVGLSVAHTDGYIVIFEHSRFSSMHEMRRPWKLLRAKKRLHPTVNRGAAAERIFMKGPRTSSRRTNGV